MQQNSVSFNGSRASKKPCVTRYNCKRWLKWYHMVPGESEITSVEWRSCWAIWLAGELVSFSFHARTAWKGRSFSKKPQHCSPLPYRQLLQDDSWGFPCKWCMQFLITQTKQYCILRALSFNLTFKTVDLFNGLITTNTTSILWESLVSFYGYSSLPFMH